MNFPKTTEFNKRIPKQKFYDNLSVTPMIKQSFIEHIKIIYWKNKIAPTTINLAEGKTVTEIEIFEIRLNNPVLDEGVLKLIDKEIHYHILFLLEYNGKYQVWIGYKHKNSNNLDFKVDAYYHTDWIEIDNLKLEIQGLDMDSVYENFIRQVAGDNLSNHDGESLQQSIEKENQRLDIKKQIDKLQKAIRKEKQFNRQIELNKQLKLFKKQLEEL